MINKVAKMPVTRTYKAAIIRTKIFAASFYGSEVAQPNERDIATFAAATAKAVANTTSNHDIDWVFSTCSRGLDLDIVTNLIARKCAMIRRSIAKRPHEAAMYREMLELHIKKGTKGATMDSDQTAQQNGSLQKLTPAPHPSRGKRKEWAPEVPPTDPIGYLLADIVTMGAKLNTKFQILIFNEPPIDIIATPYQYLYKSVVEMAARARTKAAEGTKTNNCALPEIDSTATTHSHKQMEESELVFLQTYQDGGGWNKKKLMQIGAVDDASCDLCGLQHESNDTTWNCQHPAMIKCRQETDPDLAAIGHRLIPDNIKRGVAPAMGHDHEETYWGAKMDKTKVLAERFAELLGIKAPPFQNEEATDILNKAKQLKVNERQLIATLRGGHGMGQSPDYPEDVQGSIPEKPNGYTDGSVKNPASCLWQMAGYGMYWPEPPAEHENHELTKYTYSQAAEEGVIMWGHMAGQQCHSTRTELAARLIAMLRPIPLHIATDSAALIHKAEYLMDAAAIWQLTTMTQNRTTKNPCGKPWGLQKDGDLWERFWAASLLRGPRTLKLTKVKGHTTIKDVEEGTITHELRKGNDFSDTAADNGAHQAMPGLLHLTKWMAARHKGYCNFMTRVHKFLIANSKMEKQIREENKKHDIAKKPKGKPTSRIMDRVHSCQRSHAKPLELLPPPRGKHRYSAHQAHVEDIHIFLSTLPIDLKSEDDNQDQNEDGEGTTWMELFCTFDLMGFNGPQTEEQALATVTDKNVPMRELERRRKWIEHRLQHRPANKTGLKKPLATAEAKPHLKMELDMFTRITKFIIKTSGSPHAKKCFEVREDGYKHRLIQLAITGYQPTIKGTLHIQHDQARKIAAAIIMHKVGQNSKANTMYKGFQHEIANGTKCEHWSSAADMTMRGPPRWRQGSQWPPKAYVNLQNKPNIEPEDKDRKRWRLPLINWLNTIRKVGSPDSVNDNQQQQLQTEPKPQSPRSSSAISDGHTMTSTGNTTPDTALIGQEEGAKDDDMTVAMQPELPGTTTYGGLTAIPVAPVMFGTNGQVKPAIDTDDVTKYEGKHKRSRNEEDGTSTYAGCITVEHEDESVMKQSKQLKHNTGPVVSLCGDQQTPWPLPQVGAVGGDTPSAVQLGRGTVEVRSEAEVGPLFHPSSSVHSPAKAGAGNNSLEAGFPLSVSFPAIKEQTEKDLGGRGGEETNKHHIKNYTPNDAIQNVPKKQNKIQNCQRQPKHISRLMF